jgi:Ca2+-transporting ATPase
VSPPDAHVLPLHTAVPGRARLRVRGLYRCHLLKLHIETNLPGVDGILNASANVLTGTVLVQFAPSVPLAVVVSNIELILVTPRTAAQAAARQGQSRRDATPAWHTLTARQVLGRLGCSPALGLTRSVAFERLRRHGPNALPTERARPALLAFVDQFNSLPVVLLIASAALSVATGGIGDAVAIGAVVLVNACIGFVTERRAEAHITALLSGSRMTALVCRDGEVSSTPAEDVVVGDLLTLRRGSQVVADARIVRAQSLYVDESTLTGESLPVAKTAARLAEAETPLADRNNMLYRGTVVTGGDATAVVVAAGAATEIGSLQQLVADASAPETPLQRQLRRLGAQQVAVASALSGAVLLAGLLRGHSLLEMLKTAVSLAVAAIPEGLPVVATTALASGLKAMQRHHILVRRLAAIETLGAIQVACLDKTGTLTLNRMSAMAVIAGHESFEVTDGRIESSSRQPLEPSAALKRLLEICVLCSEADANGNSNASRRENGNGSPRSSTETALMELAVANGVDPPALAAAYPLKAVRNRSDARSYMATWHASESGTLIAIKGSPTDVLARCTRLLDGGMARTLSHQDRETIQAQNDQMAGRAMRVLGLAYATRARETKRFNGGATWVGLVGMADPLRPHMPEFIHELRKAGIIPIMITGDQAATAQAVGRRLGMDPEHEVFARVNPSDKLRVLRGFQHSNHIAAMTGDGVNDAPALKAADVGITLGGEGTDVAQGVADVVLADDDITSLTTAIREGRRVGENVRDAIRYLSATNLSELLMVFGSVTCGLGTPLNTRQLLWINLLSDIFPELAFATEPAHDDLLNRPPRSAAAPVVDRDDYRRLVAEAGVLSGSALCAYALGVSRYGIGARSSTIAFTTLAAGQLLHALTVRPMNDKSNAAAPAGWVGRATGAGLALVFAAQVLPGVGQLLGAAALGPADLLVSGTAAALGFGLNRILRASSIEPTAVNKSVPLALPAA